MTLFALRKSRSWALGLGFLSLLVACADAPECPTASGAAGHCESPVGALPGAGGLGAGGGTAFPSNAEAGAPPSAGGADAAIDANLQPAPGSDGGSNPPGSDATPDSATRDATAEAATPEPAATGYVGEHGRLRVQGNRVVDRAGKPIQLRGMSWFWSQWSSFYVAPNVDAVADGWKATLVRAALGVENEGGYLANPQANLTKVRALVDRAIARGIYVIIDWHDHNAQSHMGQATSFFQEMAKAYGKQPHVIFEVFNEPLDIPWSTVKSYAEQMIRTIRAAGSENLIIVGTPNWSQDVDVAAGDPIRSDANVAYTLHFYANTHKQELRDKAKSALDRGIPLFVTEWGTCSADGNGSINEAETRTWLNFLATHSISWANWALNNKDEACSAVLPSGPSTGPWRNDQLTPSGVLVKNAIP